MDHSDAATLYLQVAWCVGWLFAQVRWQGPSSGSLLAPGETCSLAVCAYLCVPNRRGGSKHQFSFFGQRRGSEQNPRMIHAPLATLPKPEPFHAFVVCPASPLYRNRHVGTAVRRNIFAGCFESRTRGFKYGSRTRQLPISPSLPSLRHTSYLHVHRAYALRSSPLPAVDACWLVFFVMLCRMRWR